MSRWTIEIDPAVPRRRRPILGRLGRWILRLYGWRVDVRLGATPKAVVIAAPHTSNWDAVFGLAAACAAELELHFYAKHTLFRGPLGWLLRWLGGMPVDRGAAGGVVEGVRRQFEQRDTLLLALAPEGTRRRVEHWKSGWHRMARAAGVPVVVGCIDYGRREIGVAEVFEPADDYPADLARIQRIYAGVTARHPKNFACGNPVDIGNAATDERG